MTNSKSTKRALVSSALAVFMCVAMLIGTTFAWFTDTASTGVNKIQAGTLDVALEMKENGKWVSAEGKNLNFVAKDGNKNILWEPGCTYNLPELRIVNNGNLALKYKVNITGINGDAKLNEVIDWTIGEVAQGTEQKLAAGENAEFTISGTMQKTAGNAYQGLSIDGISITVYATQDTVEYDSNNNQYDKGATLPSFWDGKTSTAPTKDEDSVHHITNAAEFVNYINAIHVVGNNYKAVVLDCDIDLGGYTIEVSGEGYAFSGSFDGQNHTVSNYVIKRTDGKRYTGLFSCYDWNGASVKNLTVKNGTVISNGAQVSAIIPSLNAENGIVDNCHAYNCTVIGEKKVGAITGYVAYGTVSNCTATDCDVYASDNRADQVTVFGYDNGGTFTNNVTTNCNTGYDYSEVANGVALCNGEYLISNAEGLFWFDNLSTEDQHNKNIKLTADIDLGNRAWTPICDSHTQYSGTFDGNGHTISSLKINDENQSGNEATGLFAWTNGTIKNLTIDGAEVIGNHWVGVIAGYVQAGTIENCTVKNATVKAVYANDDRDGDKAGAVVGYLNYGALKPTITNCKAENCVVSAVRDAGQIIGCAKPAQVANCTATNVTVKEISGYTQSGKNITNDIIGRKI